MKKIILIAVVLCSALINAQNGEYSLKNIDVNTKYSDFGVSFGNENTAVFASSRVKGSIKNRIWTNNKQPYLELYKGVIGEQSEIENIENFSKELNSKFHESNIAFTKDFKTVYFSRNNYLKRKFTKDSTGVNLIQLYKAEVDDMGKWVNIQPMPFNNDNYQTGHPVLNKAENKLYFVSDMPGSMGMTDIFVVDVKSDGTYGSPKNLGPKVNTVNKEMFPSIDENEVLYYSSNGFADSKGGLDIYATKLNNLGEYYKPKNLSSPLNSEKDDFAFVINENRRGYISSNRDGGNGDDDIYSFTEISPVKFECFQFVNGVVKNEANNEILVGATVELVDKNDEVISTLISDENGVFSFKFNCKTPLKVKGSKKNYNNDFMEFNSSKAVIVELKLKRKELDSNDFVKVRGQLMIKLNPIYFDYNKANIRKDAAIELDKVVEIMNKYPNLKIEGGSHTDSRGKGSYNEKLSSRRAISTIDYIQNKGIGKSRLSAKGYGETTLVNKCSNNVKCTKEEHQLNRRTEFIIVNPEVLNQ